uniref:Centrosomal protein of 44 kDa n=1 Tax=Sphenodon punctatus TaxID=8508 RepID=A0A8D0H0V7_SPHPU
MATGDIKGNLRKIEQGLRLLNYPRDVDYTGFVKGDPSAFLPIISYCFTSFSTCIAELLVESDVELTAKSDLRFIEAIYKLLRDQFQYKPVLTKQQFLQCGFAERKIQIVCDIISSVLKRHKELSSSNKLCFVFYMQKKSQVEHHPSSDVNGHVSQDVASTVADVILFQNTEDNTQLEQLKSQIAECQEKLLKLNWMEDKLHVLEENLKGKVIIDEKDWNNLLSRVLLLETQLFLQVKKVLLPSKFTSLSEECTSSRDIYFSSDMEEKEEMPERLHQSSGYSSLLSTDPSPKALTINYPGLTEISKETTWERMERISKM